MIAHLRHIDLIGDKEVAIDNPCMCTRFWCNLVKAADHEDADCFTEYLDSVQADFVDGPVNGSKSEYIDHEESECIDHEESAEAKAEAKGETVDPEDALPAYMSLLEIRKKWHSTTNNN